MNYDTIDTEKTPIKLLLTGASGSGKTFKAAHFPAPVFFNFDNNLSCLRLLPPELGNAIKIVNPFKSNGKPVPKPRVFDNFVMQLAEVAEDSSVKTIVIDSLTTMTTVLFYKILGTDQPSTSVKIQNFGDYVRYIEWLANKLLCASDLDKHVIFIAHEQTDKDENSGKTVTNLAVSTKVKSTFGLYFTDVWRCFTSIPLTGQPKRMVRTAPTNEASYKCSLPLPAEFDFDKDLETFTKLINGLLD